MTGTNRRSAARFRLLMVAGVAAVVALLGMASSTSVAAKPATGQSDQGATAGSAPVQAAPAVGVQAVPGNWTLFFDWDCDGSYSTLAVVFNAGGTWSGGGFTGPWVSVAGMLTFTFNGSETTYSGNIASKSVTGIQTTFAGLNGCFYLLQAGVPAAASAASHDSRNAVGKL